MWPNVENRDVSHAHFPKHVTLETMTLPLKPGLQRQSVHASLARDDEAFAGQAVHDVPPGVLAKEPAGHGKQAP